MLMMWFWPSVTQAQFRSAIDVQEWPKGKIVLTSGDTLYGSIVLHRTQDVVNLQHSDGSISSFSPVNVEYFIAQEMPSGRSYFFRTLPWNLGRAYSDFKKPTFFEQLNQGPLTLIMRETYISRDVSRSGGNFLYDPYFYPSGSQWVEQVKEQYFVLLPDGEIVSLRNVRRDLHRLFGEKSGQVKDFVKENRLDYERPHELVAIVNYFNTLSTTAGLSATSP